jgi:hypothetical protein
MGQGVLLVEPEISKVLEFLLQGRLPMYYIQSI